MTAPGSLDVVGLGPGPAHWLTPEATAVLDRATDVVGYAPYVARVPERPGLLRHASDNRVELDRARHALDLALAGARVAVVSGGDPGIFAMAAAVFEALDRDGPRWAGVPVHVVPGVSAMQAAAARLGAPLGHDFCVMSLSDNLKPWSIVERRLRAAADGDFVLALYNPASAARPGQLGDAFAILRDLKSPATPVAFARAVGRPDEAIALMSLGEADPARADMSTLVIVGSSETRVVARPDGSHRMLTPRHYGGSQS